jgi:hypothetical protein
MKKHIQFILAFVLSMFAAASALFGQDIVQDLECMQSAYGTLDRYYSEIRVEIFAKGSSSAALVQKGIVQKDGNSFLYDFDGTKMLYNDDVILILNEKQRFVMLDQRVENPDLTELLAGQSADLDSMVKLCDSVAYRGMENGLKHYCVFSSRHTIQRTDLWIQDGTSLLVKLEYLYDKRLYPELNRVVVSFDKVDTKPRFARQLFSERRFLKGSQGSYQLQSPYESYELIVSQPEEN